MQQTIFVEFIFMPNLTQIERHVLHSNLKVRFPFDTVAQMLIGFGYQAPRRH